MRQHRVRGRRGFAELSQGRVLAHERLVVPYMHCLASFSVRNQVGLVEDELDLLLYLLLALQLIRFVHAHNRVEVPHVRLVRDVVEHVARNAILYCVTEVVVCLVEEAQLQENEHLRKEYRHESLLVLAESLIDSEPGVLRKLSLIQLEHFVNRLIVAKVNVELRVVRRKVPNRTTNAAQAVHILERGIHLMLFTELDEI